MKIVLHYNHGGFYINKELRLILAFCGIKIDYSMENISFRTNKTFIEELEKYKKYKLFEITDHTKYLKVFEIPDDYTDIVITDYDGFERIIYVKDGKLYDENNKRIGNKED